MVLDEPGATRGDGPDPRLQTPQVVDLAGDLARYVLHEHPERIRHTEGVVERAKLLTVAVPADHAPLLVAAAWLHDIGYAQTLRRTGFHPLDGALALRDLGWPAEVCTLVAHHSGARYVAAVRDLQDQLEPFSFQQDLLSDAVTVADQTAGPNGVAMSITERMDDMLARHGSDSPNAQAHPRRGPYLLSAAARVATRMQQAGIAPGRHGIF